MGKKICPYVNGKCIKEDCLAFQMRSTPLYQSIGNKSFYDGVPKLFEKDNYTSGFVGIQVNLVAVPYIKYYGCQLLRDYQPKPTEEYYMKYESFKQEILFYQSEINNAHSLVDLVATKGYYPIKEFEKHSKGKKLVTHL